MTADKRAMRTASNGRTHHPRSITIDRFAAVVLACIVAGVVGAPCGAGDDGAGVRAIADEYWSGYIERYPEIATYQGISTAPHGRLTDNSLDAHAAWRAREDHWLVALRKLEQSSGSAVTGTSLLAATLREALEASVAVRICRSELWNVSDTWSGWQQFMVDWMAAQPVGTVEAREVALARWRQLPRFIDNEVANLREGRKRGYTAPRSTVHAVLRQIDALLASAADESPLLEPGRRSGDDVFARALGEIVTKAVYPALQRCRDFLANEYAGAAREAVGVSALPNGTACYVASLRAHTTLALDARAVHAAGLAEISRIEQEMKAIVEPSFATDDVPALLERLQSDPQFTYRSKEELIAKVSSAVDRARVAMPQWFGILPTADVVVQPQPAFREPTTDQYNMPAEDGSRPGVYLISTWEPERMSRAESESTAFHETIPGHHLQLALAMERRNLHPIQRYLIYDYPSLRYNGAFGEGWALYAERLADEMGLFSSDRDRLGMLAQQAMRAARMVVDSGLHARGWSRDQAIEYLIAHTATPRSLAESEIDRYIAWPGQAVGYLVGALEITRLRQETTARLGERFDIREFHDRVLEDGALPMNALRRKLEGWEPPTHTP